MKSYKPGSATYKDNIPIVETTDTNHADNVNQAPKQLIENDIALKEQMDGYGFSVVDGTLCVNVHPVWRRKCSSTRLIRRFVHLRLRITLRRSTSACARLIGATRTMRGLWTPMVASTTTTRTGLFAALRLVGFANRIIVLIPGTHGCRDIF